MRLSLEANLPNEHKENQHEDRVTVTEEKLSLKIKTYYVCRGEFFFSLRSTKFGSEYDFS